MRGDGWAVGGGLPEEAVVLAFCGWCPATNNNNNDEKVRFELEVTSREMLAVVLMCTCNCLLSNYLFFY